MTSFNDVLNELAFLARSSTRVRILRELRQGGPVETHDLRDRFDCDRTTFQRNVDALEEHGWVHRTNHTIDITRAGALLLTALSDCLETTSNAMDLRPFLQWMPDDTFDFDIAHLADAEIIVSDRSHPDRVICKHTEDLADAEKFRGFTPFIGRRSLETVWDRVTAGEGRFEVIVPAENVDTLQPEYAKMLHELIQSDRVVALLTNTEIPYYLGLIDDVVQIGNQTDNGMRRAMLETDHPAVRTWAENTYEEYKQRAAILEHEPPTEAELLS